MSALKQLRELILPDVEQMVEKRLQERLPSIIEALYPSILQHVANNMHIIASNSGLKPELQKLSFQMKTGPNHTAFIGSSICTIDEQVYDRRIDDIYYQMSKLEQGIATVHDTTMARVNYIEQKIP